MSPSSKEKNLQAEWSAGGENNPLYRGEAGAGSCKDTNLEQVQMSELQISAYMMTSYQETRIRNRFRIRFQTRVKGFLLVTLSETGLLRARTLPASHWEQRSQVLKRLMTVACVTG